MTNYTKFDFGLVQESVSKDMLEYTYILTVKRDEFASYFSQKVQEIAPTVRVPGFQPGRVPVSLAAKTVIQNQGRQISEDLMRKIIEQAIQSIIKDHNVDIASMDTQMISVSEQEDLKIKIQIHAQPQLPEFDFSSLAVDLINMSPNAKIEVEEVKKSLLESSKKVIKADENYKSKVGDIITLNFSGKIQKTGETLEELNVKDLSIRLGDKELVEDFENQLIGLMNGQEKNIVVKFDKNYEFAKVAGENVEFHIVILGISKIHQEDTITEDFAHSHGFESATKMIDHHVLIATYQLSKLIEMINKKRTFDKISSSFEIDDKIPESLIEKTLEQEGDMISKEIKSKFQGISNEELDRKVRLAAIKRVKLGLLLASFAKKNQVSISDNDVLLHKDTEIKYMPDINKENKDKIEKNYKDQAYLSKVIAMITEDKIMNVILQKVNKKYTTLNEYKDLMNYQNELSMI